MFLKAFGKNDTGEMGNCVSSVKPRNLKNRLATPALPVSAWAAYSKLVGSEQSHVPTASLHLAATLFSLIRQSSAC